MAIEKRRRRGSWFWLIVRVIGVLGLFAVLLGVLGARATPGFSSSQLFSSLKQDPYRYNQLLFETKDVFLRVCFWFVAIGAIAAALTLLLQLVAGLGRLAGRRNITGTNSCVQTALMIFLLIALNVFSYHHYQRFDWTGRQFAPFGMHSPLEPSKQFRPQFTLPENVVADLKQLRGETTVVVYQRHKTVGQLNDKPDAYDYAAERKIVEKVQDLVRIFREFGSQFRVLVLDVEDEGYDDKLKELTKANPALRKAIDAAPDNSILFHTHREVPGPGGTKQVRESVQRLSFNDFYRLDKNASRSANGGRGDLVLLPQSVESFARRVLAIEEKRPKVGIAVIHEWLTTEGLKEFSAEGLRKALELHGFDVTDIVLKKGWMEGEPVPAAYTLGESQLERLEEDLAEYDATLLALREDLRRIGAILDKLKSNISLDDLNKELKPILQGRRMNEESRRVNIISLEPQVDALRDIITQQEKERADTLKQLEQLPNQERIAENRRQTDVKAKMEKLLADVDLLIVPRITLRNVVAGDRIPAKLYRLDEVQAAAIKDFMKAGKPVLGLFGPTNEPPDRRGMPAVTGPDNVEALFAQLGIIFGGQTVLFNAESKAFSQRRASLLAGTSEVDIPAVYFDRPKSGRLRADLVAEPEDPSIKPNPIAQSMKVAAAATGSADKLEKLTLRHPRPVYYVPKGGAPQFTAEFLFSDPESWNESDPFPTREKSPRYDPPKPDDPQRGTRDAETRGPFPLGVAVQVNVPTEWRNSDATGEVPLRVAAVGHGDVFAGTELSPAREQLLVNTCNWLLSRDERLPSAAEPVWEFPRVQMSERRARLWRLGSLIALPASFAFLGAMVLLVRKYR